MDVVKTTAAHWRDGSSDFRRGQGQPKKITPPHPPPPPPSLFHGHGNQRRIARRSRSKLYAIPLDYSGNLKLPAHKLRKAEDGLVFYYRGEVIPAHGSMCSSKHLNGNGGGSH